MPLPRGESPASNRAWVATLLCLLALLADGFDLQAMGITAIALRSEFSLSTGHLAWIFAANNLGLFVGAAVGGRFADRWGRRRLVIMSMFMFGVFTIVTAVLTSPDWLAIVRFATGLGLGGALANIIAIVAETGSSANRAARVTMLTAAHPLGGAIPGALLSIWPEIEWRTIFHIGGWWPLAVGAAMIWYLPESRAFLGARPAADDSGAYRAAEMTIGQSLFGGGRTTATLMLWVGFFFCVTAIYLVVNWLPMILVAQEYSMREASLAALVFPLGGAIGTVVLGQLTKLIKRKFVVMFAFGGVASSVAWMAFAAHGTAAMLTSVLLSGFFVIGAQFLLYGLSPTYYPARARGTGVGAAVAAGRLGSIAGPTIAGLLLSAGNSSGQVLMSLLPGLMLAFIAALVLTRIPQVADQ